MAATLRLDKSKFFKFWFHMLIPYLFDMRRFHDFYDRSVIIRNLKNHRSRAFTSISVFGQNYKNLSK